MFSLFRSSKLFRFGYGVTKRSISLQSIKLSTFVDKSTNLYNLKNGQFTFTRAFATPVYKERLSVEKSLHQLDHEVRNRGRISGKDIDEVIQAIQYAGSVSSSQALLLIRCCGNLAIEVPPQKRTELVAKVMATLKKLNIELDISHYNALLKVYLENKTDFHPFEFLKELESFNLRPNRVTYQYLIGTFCIKGDITGATKILELMKENKVPINENIFNFLIMGHSEANDIESAADIINIMKEKGIEPTASSYAALLCGFAKAGDLGKIRETINQCEKEEVYLLDKDYMDIIFALAMNGHEKHVDEFIAKMKKYAGYNQDIVNLVYRLLGERKDDVVVKLIKSMILTPGVDHKNGLFLINYLLRNNEPVQRLVYFAKAFKENGINDFSALTALKDLLIHEKTEDAIFMLKNMRDCNIDLRAHYFYPLFCQAGRRKDNKKILDIIRIMRYLNVSRSGVTIKNFIVRNYDLKNVLHDFGALYSNGTLNSVFLAEALFAENLRMHRIKDCEKLAKNFYLEWDKRWMQNLNQSLIKTKAVESYVTIFAHLHDSYMKEYKIIEDNLSSESSSNSEEEVAVTDEKDNTNETDLKNPTLPFGYDRDKEFGEYMIKKLIDTNGGVEFLVPVLKGMLEYGLGIREQAIEKFNVSDPEAMELVRKLASPDVSAKPIEKDTEFSQAYPLIRTRRTSMEKDELNDKDKHFLVIINQKNANEAEILFEEYVKNDTATIFHYMNLMKVYTLTKQFDKAYDIGQKIQEKFPDEDYEPHIKLYYVETLLNLKKFDEACEYFKNIDFAHHSPEILLNHIIRRYIADNEDYSRLCDIYDIAVEKKATIPRHFYHIVFAYLERKQYDEAVKVFEHVAKKYRYPVIKTQLLKEIVMHGNAELLERVTNALADINGQVSSLLDLVATFAECNKPKQARRLLETPGLELKDGRLLYMCKKFEELGNTQAIECLVTATKGMKKINRNILYDHLLSSALSLNEPAKALNLWTEMQEEELTPSDRFLRRLAQFLKSKGLPVPFVVTDFDLEVDNKGHLLVETSIMKALSDKDTNKLISVVKAAKRHDKYIPFGPILNYLRDEIVNKGKYEELAEIRSVLPNMKSALTFEAMALLAYTNAGKVEEYLEKKVAELSKMKEDTRYQNFPQRALINLLLKQPELVETIEKLDVKAQKNKVQVLSNVLWCYHLYAGQLEDAKKIYSGRVPGRTLKLLRSFCEMKNFAEPLEKVLDSREGFEMSDLDLQYTVKAVIYIYRIKKDKVNLEKFIDASVEKGYRHLIPENFVKIAEGKESLLVESSPSTQEDHFEEEIEQNEKVPELDQKSPESGEKKPEHRTFKKIETETTEEPKKSEAKTESI